MAVDNRVMLTDQTKLIQYVYQKKIYDAAGVNLDADSPALIAEKIRKAWAVFVREKESKLDCNDLSIIKYAVSNRFDDFLVDVVKWEVHLNKIDNGDGKTVLDFTQDAIISLKGTPLEPILKTYYQLFKEAGAKHRVELD